MKRSELEYRLLYSVLVAGKSAGFAEAALGRLLGVGLAEPFGVVRQFIADGGLASALRTSRTGRYALLELCFCALVKVDPETVTVAELEQIPGIGPKTARFFILWTRPGERHAALDVHVLRWLRTLGHDAPKQTPQSARRYAELESLFLDEADRLGVTPRELDEAVWSAGARPA